MPQKKPEEYKLPSKNEARALESVLKGFNVSTTLIGAHPVITHLVRANHIQEFDGHSSVAKKKWQAELEAGIARAGFPGITAHHMPYKKKEEILGRALAKTTKLVDFIIQSPLAHRRFVEALKLIHPEK